MIETQHRGHRIIYSENHDEWTCMDLGVDAPTLGKLKGKIDAIYLKLRKESAVTCWKIEAGYSSNGEGVRLDEVRVIEYVGEKIERPWQGTPKHLGHQVYAMIQRAQQAGRNKMMLHDLAPDTKETHEAVALACALYQQVKAVEATFKEAVARIPRMTADDIQGLVKAADTKLEEGDV